MEVHSQRIRVLRQGEQGRGPVVYWMSRDQRAEDNWALLYAQECAVRQGVPLAVVFCLVPEFLGATARHYGFMLRGLAEVETHLRRKNIGFTLLTGQSGREVPAFLERTGAGLLVGDFSPLRINRSWKDAVTRKIRIPFHEVDAHNIVPCRAASPKLEFGAYTLRPKLQRALPEFLEEFPKLRPHPRPWPPGNEPVNWGAVLAGLKIDRSVGEVDWIRPGGREARKALKRFVEQRLSAYDEGRNDPNVSAQSDLSPYLHFGQIAPQRVALDVRAVAKPRTAVAAFLEELIVRRELSDNFCFYNDRYDQFEGFHPWAQRTLNEHRRDRRQYLYSADQLEGAGTHDPLWNAAQRQMVKSGKMHGYLRMYWAKKILEWTASPEEALAIGIALNDRYELDGRDPNGFAGMAWSVGGVHDRAWGERLVFGKIRYMSYDGCRRKFDVDEYVKTWT